MLLIDEPTRGVDVGAKAEIYQLLDELACEGKALLVVSSELPELIGLCRRILVMREMIRAEAAAGRRTALDKLLPMHVSNVALWCGSHKGPAKVALREADGVKVRVCRKCGETL